MIDDDDLGPMRVAALAFITTVAAVAVTPSSLSRSRVRGG